MKWLALEPWLDGSHAQMLFAWQAHSQHTVEILGLPGRHWKWRQQAGALTLASRVQKAGLARPDGLWVSDYVDVAQLHAFLPHSWGRVPTGLYFHENQLTYPRSGSDPHPTDLAPAWSNLTSLMAADQVAFNSAYHRDSLTARAQEMLHQLPRPKPTEALARALNRARVLHPGIDRQAMPLGPGAPPDAPLRIAFPHRWEHDKGVAAFTAIVHKASAKGARMELVLLGEDPNPTDALRHSLRPFTLHSGRLESREAYAQMLGTCDLVFSSADHEFYGIAMLEACATGCTPIAPNRLAYPEVLPFWKPPYESPDQAVAQLLQAAGELPHLRSRGHRQRMGDGVQSHDQTRTLAAMDDWMVGLTQPSP